MFVVTDRLSVIASTNRLKTDEGFLVIKDNRLARTGIVEYRAGEIGVNDRDSMEIVRVNRPAELFTADVLDSFESKPFANTHPKGEPITVKNARANTVGHVRNLRMEGQFMVGDIIVTDATTIEDIERGAKTELSLGHKANFEIRPGVTPDGQSFDVVQTAMQGNHVALVDKGRCGSTCRVSDSASQTQKQIGTNMDTQVQHEGVTYGMSAQVAEVFGQVTVALKAERAKNSTLVADSASILDKSKGEMQAKVDTLQGKVDALEKAAVTPEQLDAMTNERADLCANAKVLVGDGFVTDGKSNEQIRREAVEKKSGKDVSEKSDEYVAAAFDVYATDGKSAYERIGDLTSQVMATDGATDGMVVNSAPISVVKQAQNKRIQKNREVAAKMGVKA